MAQFSSDTLNEAKSLFLWVLLGYPNYKITSRKKEILFGELLSVDHTSHTQAKKK